MKDLIEAFQIFGKYTDSDWPTSCEHDIMYVFVKPELVSKADIVRLDELSFTADFDDLQNFSSFRFGSS